MIDDEDKMSHNFNNLEIFSEEFRRFIQESVEINRKYMEENEIHSQNQGKYISNINDILLEDEEFQKKNQFNTKEKRLKNFKNSLIEKYSNRKYNHNQNIEIKDIKANNKFEDDYQQNQDLDLEEYKNQYNIDDNYNQNEEDFYSVKNFDDKQNQFEDNCEDCYIEQQEMFEDDERF